MIEADLYRTRKISELLTFVDSTLETTRNDKIQLPNARLHKGLFNKFFKELVPLKLFCEEAYKNNFEYSVRLIKGNQPYDAEVVSENGFIHRIELTCSFDWKKEYDDAILINNRSYGKIEVWDYLSIKTIQDSIKQKILEGANKKSLRDYGDTILVLLLNTYPYYDLTNEADLSAIEEICAEIQILQFRVKELFLLTWGIKTEKSLLKKLK